jgi:hypothetical protein
MPYIWIDNDIRLSYQGVHIYWAYDNDCVDDPLMFKFCLSSFASEYDQIDIREWSGYHEPDKDIDWQSPAWEGWEKHVNKFIMKAIDQGLITQEEVNF